MDKLTSAHIVVVVVGGWGIMIVIPLLCPPSQMSHVVLSVGGVVFPSLGAQFRFGAVRPALLETGTGTFIFNSTTLGHLLSSVVDSLPLLPLLLYAITDYGKPRQ